MPVWKNLIILILYPDLIFQIAFCIQMNKIEFQVVRFNVIEAAFNQVHLPLAFSYVFMALYSQNIYVLLLSYLAELLCLSINIQAQLSYLSIFFHHGLPTLARCTVEMKIICKLRHMEYFQTIFSNSYQSLASQLLTFSFLPLFLQLAQV